MTDLQQRAEELMAHYEKQRARTAELRQKIGEIRATAKAPRNTVKVTVGVQGDLTAVEFPTGAYKRMPPKELADCLLATIEEAKASAARALRELMNPELGSGLTVDSLLGGRSAPAEADIPEEVQAHLVGGRGLAAGRRAS